MMKKQSKAAAKAVEKPASSTGTVIGSGIIIEGAVLKGSGVIRIDGEFHGTVDIKGHVILGETGQVSGDVFAESALFAGKYQGNLHIKETLHVTSTAVLTGRIDTGKIIIDEGGIFNGTCNVAQEGEVHNIQDAAKDTANSDSPFTESREIV